MNLRIGLVGLVRKNGQKLNRADGEERTPPPPPPQAFYNRLKGSTMLAVIAAMLFIGIVTAAMLKNTGSQATASGSYSNMHVMSSTVRSGMIATETLFRNKDILALIADAANGSDTAYIIGTKRNKQPLGSSNQFFRSRIDTVGDGINPFAIFSISAGKKQGGRDIKRALAYYRMENVRVYRDGNADYPTENAFSSASDMDHIKAPLKVSGGGNVTIEKGTAEWQRAVTFDTGTEVYFGGPIKFTGNNADNVFKDKAYFHDNATITLGNNNSHITFESDVGFNKNLYTDGDKTLNVGKNFAINGNLGRNGGDFKVNGIKNNPDTSKFYYTDALPIQTSEQPIKPTLPQHSAGTSAPSGTLGVYGYNTITFTTPIAIPSGCVEISLSIYGAPTSNCVYFETEATNGLTTKLRIKDGTENNYSGVEICTIPGHPFCCQPVPSPFVNSEYSKMPQCVWQCDASGDKIVCLTHPDGHTRISDEYNNGGNYPYVNEKGIGNASDGWNQNRISGYSESNKIYVDTSKYPDSKDRNAVLAMLDMDPLEVRREKQMINISNTDSTSMKLICDSPNSPNCLFNNLNMSGSSFVQKLNDLYTNATPNQLFADHLVIEVNTNSILPDMSGIPFDKKVMFIVKDGYTFNAQNGLYNSGENASTLIYADKGNATINLNIKNDFRGLICIDEKNTVGTLNPYDKHQIKFDDNHTAKVYGAIHNLSTKAKLEVVGGDVTLQFDKKVLSAFTPLACDENNPDRKQYCEKTGGKAKAEYIDVLNPRKLTALGYYFY